MPPSQVRQIGFTSYRANCSSWSSSSLQKWCYTVYTSNLWWRLNLTSFDENSPGFFEIPCFWKHAARMSYNTVNIHVTDNKFNIHNYTYLMVQQKKCSFILDKKFPRFCWFEKIKFTYGLFIYFFPKLSGLYLKQWSNLCCHSWIESLINWHLKYLTFTPNVA